eukprot:UN25740
MLLDDDFRESDSDYELENQPTSMKTMISVTKVETETEFFISNKSNELKLTIRSHGDGRSDTAATAEYSLSACEDYSHTAEYSRTQEFED